MYTAFKRYDTEGPFKLRQETGEFLSVTKHVRDR